MIDIPADLPKSIAPTEKKLQSCVAFASKQHKVHPSVIRAIIKVEGGKIGTMSRNTNNTYDMGIMQINTIHIPDLRKKYPTLNLGWEKISQGACLNIFLGTGILRDRLNELKDPKKDFWKGVGNYHSKTPHLRKRYLKKIYEAYKQVIGRS